MREFRRIGTGIGRWISNLLDVRSNLAPGVRVVGIGAYRDGIDVAVPAPRGPWIGATLNGLLRRERVGLWLSPYFKIPPGISVPAFSTVHDTIPATILHRRIGFSLRLRWSLARAERIVTVSEHSRRDLVDRWDVAEDRIILAPNSVGAAFDAVARECDLAVLSALRLARHEYALAVVDDRPHKNLSTLVEAFGHGEGPPVVVVGSRADLPPPFRTTGPIEDATLAALYRHARVVLHPALQEGFGLPALEAMACGAPVALADISPLREIAGANARYVSPLDVEGWRAAVQNPPQADATNQRADDYRSEKTYAALWSAVTARLS